MLLVVTGVGALIHLYSVGYMHDDPGYARYFAYLNLFVFSMTMLVLAGNYLLLYVFWEAVGLCSYLLIGFWYTRPAAARPARRRSSSTASAISASAWASCGCGRAVGHARLRAACSRRPPRSIPPDGDRHRAAALHGRVRQVGAAAAPHVAAGRDGGAHAGVGPHPRGDDGHGRRLHGGAEPGALRAVGRRARGRGVGRGGHGDLRGHHRPRPDRHQACARLFHGEPARVHVRGGRARRLRRGDLPPRHPRLLQGAAVPRRRQRHPRARRRAGSPEDGRAVVADGDDDDRDDDRRARSGGAAGAGRVLLEGRDPRRRVRERPPVDVGVPAAGRLPHVVLHRRGCCSSRSTAGLGCPRKPLTTSTSRRG